MKMQTSRVRVHVSAFAQVNTTVQLEEHVQHRYQTECRIHSWYES
jgi:hypothetical protein